MRESHPSRVGERGGKRIKKHTCDIKKLKKTSPSSLAPLTLGRLFRPAAFAAKAFMLQFRRRVAYYVCLRIL